MVLLWAKHSEMVSALIRQSSSSVLEFLPLQILLGIVLDTTKSAVVSSGSSGEDAQQPMTRKRNLVAVFSCLLLGYEVVRGVVGKMIV